MSISPLNSVLTLNYNGWNGYLIKDIVGENLVFPAFEFNQALLHKHESEFDAVLFNINLSCYKSITFGMELKIKDFVDSDKVVLNEGIYDIRKRELHKLLDKCMLTSAKAKADGDPDELLMVKTNLNWGGEKESLASSSIQEAINYKASSQSLLGHRAYYVKKRKEIDSYLWNDRSVVIEKYIQNKNDYFFRLYCCGESYVLVRACDERLVKKISGHPDDTNSIFIHDDLISGNIDLPKPLYELIYKFVSISKVDFCAVDIVYNDKGEFYIIDMNLTPWAGISNIQGGIIQLLRSGLKRRILQKLWYKRQHV